ncbi:hypothetical protein A2865_02445 [Candidatus Woesebacteria bacterium RIFCSPHIGHO2_01_FULL_39_17]|uniref:Integral membrane protein n=3 Tax=Candidatus Woeseibacteriota TaxID=1752722 RepID=A0A0G0QSU6_9BACT|nr:MAG: hypothetical protein US72_C0004G0006 [Microgenomates group bacterium GW2011_GWC1_38_12]KKQ93701.1 MAG: hypothetical protein UT19_C0008G0026 [Candidatus Woesebacteria bacterium GW2011_GWB1_39_10b]KKR13445.1 MAG: hypothetical protein UT40_C0017G0031 [Candidatus Woesebacteria bacterium GW2011_GWA1_39_21b]OGM24108.1 MAG: hypothetical protein A2865_02445 [Candidatus Woesebacteria bacterium RIFCSPHIGHO2_01_FULL_39_17]OGM62883.1 MAG: hypothetical protein A3A52_03655 [Candidatus Woesebacteria b
MRIAQNPWGVVNPPSWLSAFGGGTIQGIPILINIILRTLIVGAGIYTIINLILAGYAYLSAAGDAKRIADATNKITHSIIGLVVAAGAFVVGGIISQILFGDPAYLLQLRFFSPQ